MKLINFIRFRKNLFFRRFNHLYQCRNSNGFIIKNIQNNKMKLSTEDKGIHYDLITNGIREPQSTKIIKEIITKDDVIVDIGANVGYYTLLMKKAKKIYALEPSSKNYSNLEINIKLNNLNNIILIKKAIGNINGYAILNLSSKGNLNTIKRLDKEFVGKENVEIKTFDNFVKSIKDTPTFVRINVEGYESEIINGMKGFLKNNFKIFIELHPHLMNQEETLGLLNILNKNGFEIRNMFRCYTVPEMQFKNDIEWDYNINQLINDN